MRMLWVVSDILLSLLPVIIGLFLFFVSAFDTPKRFDPVFIPIGLGILSTIAAFGFVRYEIDKARHRRLLEKILFAAQSPGDSHIVKLDKLEAYYEYLLLRARNCDQSWHDMGGFDPRLKDMPNIQIRQDYYLERERLANRVPEFRYLGVFGDVGHLDRIEKLIRRSAKHHSVVRYLDGDTSGVGKIEVTIVDGREVIIGYYRPESELQSYIAASGAPAVALFEAYYADLWRAAEKNVLKSMNAADEERIKKLRRQLAEAVS
jgi:hypothetical protein